MIDYKMTPELAKVLTEFLGECYREWEKVDEEGICSKCQMVIESHPSHTFTTPDDAHKVMEKLVEKRLWKDFHGFAYRTYCANCETQDYLEWLFFNKERFCKLAADYWRTI